MPRAVALLLFCSGAAALTHQVTWVRLIGLSLGATSVAVATVLAAFFGGLAVGAALAAKFSRGPRADLARVATLEIAIGVSGLLLLPVLLQVDALLAIAPGLGSALPARFALCVALLGVPTVCMGAVFPLVAGAAVRDAPEASGRSRGLAWIYGVNTAGAVVGALATGFVFVPAWGLGGAVASAAAANFAAAVFARRAGRRAPASFEAALAPSSDARAGLAARPSSALIVLLTTGAAATALEIAWTKALAVVTGATLYGFAMLLGIFLSGLAAGSLALRSLVVKRTELWLAIGLVLLAALVLASRAALTHLPDVADALTGAAPLFETSLWLRAALALPVLLPAACIFGALFPLALSLYCGGSRSLVHGAGRGTAFNTLAGIAGSLLAGLWWIPRWGSDALLASVAFALALASLPLARGFGVRGRAAALAAVALVGLVAIAGPALDYRPLLAAVRYRLEDRHQPGPDYLFVEEGRAAVVSVSTRDGRRLRLESNGIQESWWQRGAPERRPRAELLLALAPVLLHEDPDAALVVGFGAGHSVEALTWTALGRIRVVELEPAVVDAVRATGGDVSALIDRRVELVFNDARNALIVEGSRYDLIVSQPSHPWLAGSGNLFTREFFAIVASRLEPGGMHAQWMNLLQVDAATFRSILSAFFAVHAHGITFFDSAGADLVLIGSDAPLRIDYERIGSRLEAPELASGLAAVGFEGPRDLLRFFALSRDEALRAAGDAAPNTDLRLLTESRRRPTSAEPAGDGSALALLSAHFALDLAPYFPASELARRYYEAGRFLAVRGASAQARIALARLRELDAGLAELLERDAIAPGRSGRVEKASPLE